MKRPAIMAAVVLAAVNSYAYVTWKNLDDAHRVGGRKVSEGYLRGKVVMVCQCTNETDRLEAIWDSFKTQQFVMIGAFDTMPKRVTFPVYREASLAKRTLKVPYYVVTPTGRIPYHGDDERVATDVIVGALSEWQFPRDGKRWQRAMAWEIENQPAHAVLRYEESAKEHPEEAKEFEVPVRAFRKMKEMPQLLKLVSLVKEYNDYMPKDANEREEIIKRITDAIAENGSLKKSADEQISREAKNAIADLTWYIHEI